MAFDLAEGLSTGATIGCIGVVDIKALLFDRVVEVDRGTLKVRDALAVDDETDSIELDNGIAFFDALVKEELIFETRATARVNGNTEAIVIAVFLREKVLDLGCSIRGQDNAMLCGGSGFHTHDSNDTREVIPR